MSVGLEAAATKTPARGYFKNPWRKPRVLQGVTIGYLLWSLLPVVIAVIFSFNDGRSRIVWQGFSLRWWTADPFDSILHDPIMQAAIVQTYRLAILVVLITVPIGTLFAIAVDRWHGRPARGANFVMLLSFVVPEIILGTSLFILFTTLLTVVNLGTPAQTLGLAVFQVSYPAVIVRARLLTIGPEYEEAAMDLGATPSQSIRRILLPLISPAILASVALVFADVVDDFVTVNALSGPASSETIAQKIYSASRASPTPEINAAATVMLITTLTIVGVGLLLYRRLNRGQRSSGASDLMQL
ncbi:MAG TPA: ABC transporter permease [Actinomycetota bacterium]|nr:ABC transporter permease [Actinomycetota bacterium]